MWSILKTSLALSATLAWFQLHVATAIKIQITNMCAEEFELSHLGKGTIVSVEKFASGSTVTKNVPGGSASQLFKAGRGAQATLAEITVDPDRVWFDISIIPTGVKGPGDCNTFEACKALTKGHSYNYPMQIIPAAGPSKEFLTCHPVTCMSDGCPEAYLFPSDNDKMHTCNGNTDLSITFCPGGPGRQAPAPTTPPPTTPAPTTPAPTTPAPTTPEPTTPAPTTPAPTTPEPTTESPTSSPAQNESSTFSSDGGFLGGSVPAPTPVEPTVVGTSAPVAKEVTTKSSQESSSGAGIYVMLSVGAAAMVAGSVIFVLRKKKAALEALDQKTPRPTTVRASNAFALATPQESTVL